jgi:hypothetical protein
MGRDLALRVYVVWMKKMGDSLLDGGLTKRAAFLRGHLIRVAEGIEREERDGEPETAAYCEAN